MKPAIIVVVSPSYSPCASDEANQSGRERPTQPSADIFWNGLEKQRKRSRGRAGKTACKSLYEIGLRHRKRTRRNWLYRSQFRLHLSRKIIRILRRIATNPVLFLCRSPRTAHRIQKTCVLFFAVLSRLLFRVRIRPLPEDISNSLRRALAAATPSLPAQNLYLLLVLWTGKAYLEQK